MLICFHLFIHTPILIIFISKWYNRMQSSCMKRKLYSKNSIGFPNWEEKCWSVQYFEDASKVIMLRWIKIRWQKFNAVNPRYPRALGFCHRLDSKVFILFIFIVTYLYMTTHLLTYILLLLCFFSLQNVGDHSPSQLSVLCSY